jgi:hypothetical protein
MDDARDAHTFATPGFESGRPPLTRENAKHLYLGPAAILLLASPRIVA